jgi:hypothetical protein
MFLILIYAARRSLAQPPSPHMRKPKHPTMTMFMPKPNKNANAAPRLQKSSTSVYNTSTGCPNPQPSAIYSSVLEESSHTTSKLLSTLLNKSTSCKPHQTCRVVCLSEVPRECMQAMQEDCIDVQWHIFQEELAAANGRSDSVSTTAMD